MITEIKVESSLHHSPPGILGYVSTEVLREMDTTTRVSGASAGGCVRGWGLRLLSGVGGW